MKLTETKHGVEILWGTKEWRREDDLPPAPEPFYFETKEELDAFVFGVEQGVGWPAYEVSYLS